MKSNKPKDGGQAFPLRVADSVLEGQYQPGMSLRDYFAGQALMGFCAREAPGETSRDKAYTRAVLSYLAADQMLAEGEKTNE